MKKKYYLEINQTFRNPLLYSIDHTGYVQFMHTHGVWTYSSTYNGKGHVFGDKKLFRTISPKAVQFFERNGGYDFSLEKD